MHVGIIGSRSRNTNQDKKQVEQVLLKLLEQHGRVTIVSGGCPKGGDKFAEELAHKYQLPIIIHLPDKSKLPANPQSWHFAQINYKRNQWIARNSAILIALVANDRKGGTENTIYHFIKTYKKDISSMYILENERGFDL